VNVDNVLVADEVHAPNAIQQAWATEDDSRLPPEGQQQLELDRGERERSTAQVHGPGRLIDDELAELVPPGAAFTIR